MRISIIIPTRNRGEYLDHCLKTCLATDDKDIEVIVSDNNSVDQTRAVVAGITDSRLSYFNTGKSLSMRQNFEFALSKATGDYIMIIGDDDGVLRNGLSTLRFLIESHRPDVINWNLVRYIWPHTQPTPTDGSLNFRSRDFFGPLHQRNPAAVLSQFCGAETIRYKDGANLYHGCVARHVIETLRKKTGEYFQAQSPDVWASIANLTAAQSFLWVINPITIGGESEKSTGAAWWAKQSRTITQAEIAEGYTALANVDAVTPEYDYVIRSLVSLAYANLNRVNNLICNNRLAVDHQRWRNAVLHDLRTMPLKERVGAEEALQRFFSEADPQYRREGCTVAMPAPSANPTSATADISKNKKKRHRKLAARHTQTVASVAEWINTVTGTPYFPKAPSARARFFQLWKMIEMNIKAMQLGGT